MNIKEYTLNKSSIDDFETIRSNAENSYYQLNDYIETSFNYDVQLYDLYNNYLKDLNVKMLTFRDFVKFNYDRIDATKAIFKNDKNLYAKIEYCLKNLEVVFKTYYYMTETLEKIRIEYDNALAQYKTRNTLGKSSNIDIRSKWESTSSFHYDVLMNINEFMDQVAEPQLSIAEVIYESEMDFHKALNLTEPPQNS